MVVSKSKSDGSSTDGPIWSGVVSTVRQLCDKKCRCHLPWPFDRAIPDALLPYPRMSKRKARKNPSGNSARGPFFKNIPISHLTDQERKEWVVAMGESARSEVSDSLAQLEELTRRVEPLLALAVMESYALMRFVTRNNGKPRAVPEVQQGHVEFLQALFLHQAPNTERPLASPDDIQVFFQQLPRLFGAQQHARLPDRHQVHVPESEDEGALRLVQEYLRAHTTVVRNWGYFSTVSRISRELLMVSAGEIPEWVADQMGHQDTRMVSEVYAKWVQRPDTTPGESAAKIYEEEWRRAASWADHVNVLPVGVDDGEAEAGTVSDDEEEDDDDL